MNLLKLSVRTSIWSESTFLHPAISSKNFPWRPCGLVNTPKSNAKSVAEEGDPAPDVKTRLTVAHRAPGIGLVSNSLPTVMLPILPHSVPTNEDNV